MSVEHAKKFIDRVEEDEALRAKVREATENLLRVAKEHGFDFSRQELHDVLRERFATKLPGILDPIYLSEPPGF